MYIRYLYELRRVFACVLSFVYTAKETPEILRLFADPELVRALKGMKRDMNWSPRSESTVFGKPKSFHTASLYFLAACSAVIVLEQGMKRDIFDKRSMQTIIKAFGAWQLLRRRALIGYLYCG